MNQAFLRKISHPKLAAIPYLAGLLLSLPLIASMQVELAPSGSYVSKPAAKNMVYTCDGNLAFKAKFTGLNDSKVSIEDWAGDRYVLTLTKERQIRKYTNAKGTVIFGMQAPNAASLTIVDTVHSNCRAN